MLYRFCINSQISSSSHPQVKLFLSLSLCHHVSIRSDILYFTLKYRPIHCLIYPRDEINIQPKYMYIVVTLEKTLLTFLKWWYSNEYVIWLREFLCCVTYRHVSCLQFGDYLLFSILLNYHLKLKPLQKHPLVVELSDWLANNRVFS